MKIIHFSDPHIGAFPDAFSAFFDKRLVGTLNYTFRRRFLHDTEYFRKAVEYILHEKPDVAVCTGDITSTGQPAEFETAVEILRPLIESEVVKLLYVPGNHDAYVNNARCRDALRNTFSILNANTPALESLPVKVTVKECDFILLNECRPTNIFLSSGTVTEKSSAEMEKLCSEEKHHPRILIGHFPLRKKYPVTGFRHKIYDHGRVLELLNSGKIDLSLCGHTHKYSAETDERGRGEITAGSVTRTKDLNIIQYSSASNRFSGTKHILE